MTILRPTKLSEFIGQDNVKQQIEYAIKASKIRNDILPHIIMSGSAGTGKTLLAEIIAKELGCPFTHLIGTNITAPAQLSKLLIESPKNAIVFLDEGHRMKEAVTEVLLGAMETWNVTIMTKYKDKNDVVEKPIDVKIEPFTLIMATNYLGSISKPLLSRFGIQLSFSDYTQESIESIIKASAKRLQIRIDKKAIGVIAERSRCNPRTANHYLLRARDIATVEKSKSITIKTTEKAFSIMEVDSIGLTKLDRKYLRLLSKNLKPISIKYISKAIGEPVLTIEEIVETFLISEGLISICTRGRSLTPLGASFVNKKDIR